MAESKEQSQPLLDPADDNDGRPKGNDDGSSPRKASSAGAEQYANDMKSGIKYTLTQAAMFFDMDFGSVDPRSLGISPTVPWIVVRDDRNNASKRKTWPD